MDFLLYIVWIWTVFQYLKQQLSDTGCKEGLERRGNRQRQREHPDLSTVIDYVLFTFHCFDAQSGQVFY